MRLKFVVAYDGTDFRGWARSPGHRTVHQVISEAIQRVTGSEVELVGASRTDSGAHARGQVCHFDTEVPLSPTRWPAVINRVLPADVAVLRASCVSSQFHSRFCAEDRWYRYRILTTERDPFVSRHAHDHGKRLDLNAMQEAAKSFVGEHDFCLFTAGLDKGIENTVRRIRSVTVHQVREEVRIDVVGTAFLRGMMRTMAGALLEIGAGRRDIENIAYRLRVLPSTAPRPWPLVLPAKGLCLMKVRYGNPPKDCRNKAKDEH